MTVPITIPFKGDRSYAQIADIFTQMIHATDAGEGSDLLFTVHSPLFTPFVVIEQIQYGTRPSAGLAARLDYINAQGNRCQAIAREAPRDDVIPRRHFDEDALRAQIVVNAQQATVEGTFKNDFAELITAMNKKLLQSLFPQKNAKWWAVRLQLKTMQTDWRKITLTCLNTQPGRLYNSTISVDSTDVGEINFVSRPI